MKPGDLVRIDRASIGVPQGTLGLVVKDASSENLCDVWWVTTYGIPRDTKRRYLEEDLDIV